MRVRGAIYCFFFTLGCKADNICKMGGRAQKDARLQPAKFYCLAVSPTTTSLQLAGWGNRLQLCRLKSGEQLSVQTVMGHNRYLASARRDGRAGAERRLRSTTSPERMAFARTARRLEKRLGAAPSACPEERRRLLRGWLSFPLTTQQYINSRASALS